MAVSRIEEKILGRLARQLAPSNALVASSLFTVLGLSIQLSRRLYRARKLRKLDPTRDTPSLQLYHHIVWLAREGLSITETRVLPYLQSSDYAPEYRVMAAKLQASLRHVLCLFDSIPSPSVGRGSPQQQISSHQSQKSSPKRQAQQKVSGSKQGSPKGSGAGSRRRSNGKAALRDPIPSVTSDASYVTNPYAAAHTPPGADIVPIINEARRSTPVRPPGLAPINIAANIAAASFLLNDEDKVPATKGYFNHAQHLADTLLSPTNALRLSVSLEHAVFLWDCANDQERARKIAKRAIREVYASSDGLDDEEFADASALVQALGGIVKRGSSNLTPDSNASRDAASTASPPEQRRSSLNVDRTINLSPTYARNQHSQSPAYVRRVMHTPERLSTVPEVDSVAGTRSPSASSQATIAKQATRIPQRRTSSSAASDKASKRRLVEQAEEVHRRNSKSNGRGHSSSSSRSQTSPTRPHSRQATPPEGYVRSPQHSVGTSRRRNGGNG